MMSIDQAADRNIHEALARGDFERLTTLYTLAADASEQKGKIDEACFFLTHAYVFALQQGSPHSATLHARLTRHGREN